MLSSSLQVSLPLLLHLFFGTYGYTSTSFIHTSFQTLKNLRSFQSFSHKHDDENSTRTSYNYSSSMDILNRRQAISTLTLNTIVPSIVVSTAPRRVHAAETRISQYPSLEYLEPIYELKLSVDTLKLAMTDPSKAKRPFILKRLEKMFSGGIFSEMNFLFGLALTYNNQIQYSESELPAYIKIDKDERLRYIDSTLKSLESLKNNLKKGDGMVEEEILVGDAENAQKSIAAWFSMIPKEEVDAVDKLFRMSREADVNRDGKLDASELATLPEKERDIWLKRVVLIGD